MNREQKEAVVEKLATELSEAQAIFAVDYRGISVPQAAELRTELRNADTSFRVVKNRLTTRAADKAGTEPLKDWLEGPTALALVKGDAAAAAKTLSKLGDEFEVLEYKGGLMDGTVLAADDFKAIAKLPSRDALNAQLAGIVASPITGLVRGLGSMIQGLASQLGQMADQGLVTGEPPTAPGGEAEEAGDAEEPKEEAAPAAEESPAEEEKSEETPAGEEGGEAEAEEVAESDGEAEDPAPEPPAEEKTEEPEEAPKEDKTEPEEPAAEASDDSATETSETEETKED